MENETDTAAATATAKATLKGWFAQRTQALRDWNARRRVRRAVCAAGRRTTARAWGRVLIGMAAAVLISAVVNPTAAKKEAFAASFVKPKEGFAPSFRFWLAGRLAKTEVRRHAGLVTTARVRSGRTTVTAVAVGPFWVPVASSK